MEATSYVYDHSFGSYIHPDVGKSFTIGNGKLRNAAIDGCHCNEFSSVDGYEQNLLRRVNV
jgi:hypothetical protein